MTHFSHGYALLIGVGAHQNPVNALPATIRDVQAVERLLRDPARCGYPANQVRLLCDAAATRQGMLDGLAWLQSCAAQDPDATIVVFYSGHGYADLMSGDYWLIPYDGIDTATALTAADFSAALQTIPATRLLVILDCCHAEGLATAKQALLGADEPEAMQPNQPILSMLKQGEGRVVCTSSRGRQRSYIRPDQSLSIFTYHLLEALQGANNQPGDTVVTVGNLMNYLGKTVPETAAATGNAQTPWFDLAAEDFPIATIAGGKGLEAGGWEAMAADAQIAIAAAAPVPTYEGTVTVRDQATVDGIVAGIITGNITYQPKDRNR